MQLSEVDKSAIYESINKVKTDRDMRHSPVLGRPCKTPRLEFPKLIGRFLYQRKILMCPETNRMALKKRTQKDVSMFSKR